MKTYLISLVVLCMASFPVFAKDVPTYRAVSKEYSNVVAHLEVDREGYAQLVIDYPDTECDSVSSSHNGDFTANGTRYVADWYMVYPDACKKQGHGSLIAKEEKPDAIYGWMQGDLLKPFFKSKKVIIDWQYRGVTFTFDATGFTKAFKYIKNTRLAKLNKIHDSEVAHRQSAFKGK